MTWPGGRIGLGGFYMSMARGWTTHVPAPHWHLQQQVSYAATTVRWAERLHHAFAMDARSTTAMFQSAGGVRTVRTVRTSHAGVLGEGWC